MLLYSRKASRYSKHSLFSLFFSFLSQIANDSHRRMKRKNWSQVLPCSSFLFFNYLPNSFSEAEENLQKSLKIVKDAGAQWKDKVAESDVWNTLGMVHKTAKKYQYLSFFFIYLFCFIFVFDTSLLIKRP